MSEWKNGKYEYENGTIAWYRENHFHREDGPAIELENGAKHWCIYGRLHREDGPAIETYFVKKWSINGKWHREDGPAMEYYDGRKEWYIHGKQFTEDEFNDYSFKKIMTDGTNSDLEIVDAKGRDKI